MIGSAAVETMATLLFPVSILFAVFDRLHPGLQYGLAIYLFAAAALARLARNKWPKAGLVDAAVLLVAFSEAIECALSTYPPLSRHAFFLLADDLALYGFVRLAVTKIDQLELLLWNLVAVGSVLSGRAIWLVHKQRQELAALGASNDPLALVQIITLGAPPGETPNEWATVFIVLAAFPLALCAGSLTGARRLLLAGAIAACIVASGLSLSRGVYAGSIVMATVAILLWRRVAPEVRLGKGVIGPSVAAALLTLAAISLLPAVIRTVLASRPTLASQRLAFWQDLPADGVAQSLLGVGAGTLALYHRSGLGPLPDTTLPRHILAEKGIVGLAVYAILIVVVVSTIRRRLRSKSNLLARIAAATAAAFAGIVVRELGTFSLASNGGVAAACWILAAMCGSEDLDA